MVNAALAIVVLILPGFDFLLHYPSASALTFFQISSAYFIGPALAAMAELFPVGMRSSGIGVAYNCAVTIFDGFAPLIATVLLARTGNPLSPTWYVMFSCGLSLLALGVTLRRYGRALLIHKLNKLGSRRLVINYRRESRQQSFLPGVQGQAPWGFR